MYETNINTNMTFLKTTERFLPFIFMIRIHQCAIELIDHILCAAEVLGLQPQPLP